ncbi:hypothetical protein K431DRAFT_21265 [Polychaeton citri CBS 116435]|uniref:Uncharacterized protein n=1 Tax=Polychaeton citri CBS 116435 TaxID=1314669 RepID=A0A9P4PWM0_9PEZI|nr:hypothetical protein K431DRAFT_21265 [Polychaeton citri CBS 116435]
MRAARDVGDGKLKPRAQTNQHAFVRVIWNLSSGITVAWLATIATLWYLIKWPLWSFMYACLPVRYVAAQVSASITLEDLTSKVLGKSAFLLIYSTI